MSRRTSTSAAIVVAALALTATACGSGSGGGDSGTRIGLALSSLDQPFFVQMKKGAEAEAKKAGVSLNVQDAQDDASQQANQVQNFVSRNMAAVILNPVDSDAAAPSAKAAARADVPVVAADRAVNGATVAATVASDNVEGGRMAARALADQLGGRGSVLVLRGQPGTSSSRERGKGFAEGMKEFPGIEVAAEQPADFDRTKGLDVTTNMLQSHPDVDGIFAENDEMALGAIKALGAKAGKSVRVVGFDGTPDGLRAVREGTLAVTVAQQPAELGRTAVRYAPRAAKGEKTEGTVEVPVKVVTEKNVDRFD